MFMEPEYFQWIKCITRQGLCKSSSLGDGGLCFQAIYPVILQLTYYADQVLLTEIHLLSCSITLVV